MGGYFRVHKKWDAESSGLSEPFDLTDLSKPFDLFQAKLPLEFAWQMALHGDAESSGLSKPVVLIKSKGHGKTN